MSPTETTKTIWTVGHSTRPLADFAGLIQAEGITLLADVRRFPASRRHPQFNQDELAKALEHLGIGYLHFADLGGRRGRREAGSPNTGWRVEAFNAFADYMGTPEFERSLTQLIAEAQREPTGIMCAEALPWRCHRRLIADALIVRGWRVLDIIGPNKVEPHHLTEFARVDGTRISYPAEPLFSGE